MVLAGILLPFPAFSGEYMLLAVSMCVCAYCTASTAQWNTAAQSSLEFINTRSGAVRPSRGAGSAST
jgi:hypothetical protein